MAEPSTMICKKCGEGHDPGDFPLSARFDNNQQICYLCINPTHKYKNDNGNWKKCVIYFINPTTPETIDVRDVEIGTTHTIPVADVKPYDPNEEEQDEQQDPPLQEQIDDDQRSQQIVDNNEQDLPGQNDVQIISEEEIRALENDNALDETTANILKRNIHIFNRLKHQSANISQTDFKMIYDATIISANMNLKAQPANNNNNEDNYTKRLYQETTIKSFTEKYPLNEQEYYKYSATISIYVNEHNEIPESRLLEEVIKKCTDDERRRWNRWKKNKSTEIIQINPNQTKHQILQSLNIFKHYEAFIIRDLNITPNREKLISLLLFIRTGYNERPTSTYHRICTYLDQINSVIRNVNMNKVTKYPMKEIDTECINSLYKRVFLLQNAEEQYGNDGRLNKKVREYLQRYVNQHDFELDAFIRKLKAAEEHALPNGTEKPGKLGYVWQTFKKNITIFEHKPYDKIINRKRPLLSQQNHIPTKRQKVSWETERCTFGIKCKFYINGNCNKYHTKQEINKLNKKRIKQLENNINKAGQIKPKPFQYKQRINKWGNKFTIKPRDKDNKNENKACKFGEKCRTFQKGKCRYKHTRSQIICSHCNKPGHLQYQCYSWKNQNNNKPEFQTYNPQRTPNPNPPTPYGNNLYTSTYPFNQQITDMNSVIPNQFMLYPQINPIPNMQIPQPNALVTNRLNQLQTALKDSKSISDGIKKQIKQLEQQKDNKNNIYTQHARRS